MKQILVAVMISLSGTNVLYAGGAPIRLDHPEQMKVIDLTHPLNENAVFWPNAPVRFKLLEVFRGMVRGLFFYSANTIEIAEHGGTHIDAPIHFAEQGKTVSEIPLEQLMGEGVVLNISAQAAKDVDYQLTVQDIRGHEKKWGRIPRNSIVLLRTDWSKKYGDLKAYLGDDTKGDASKLKFPSLGDEAVRFLIEERSIKALGVDVASVDPGRSQDFPVHQRLAHHNIPGFENLAHLDQLPERGAYIFALPSKIEKGTGAPLRAIGLVRK